MRRVNELEMRNEVSLVESIGLFQHCYHAHPQAVVEVWEPTERFEGDGGIPGSGVMPPNRVGCTECGEMVRIVD